jgi:hypothetical protein
MNRSAILLAAACLALLLAPALGLPIAPPGESLLGPHALDAFAHTLGLASTALALADTSVVVPGVAAILLSGLILLRR